MSIKVRVVKEKLRAKLERLKGITAHKDELMHAIGEQTLTLIGMGFRTSTAPDGTPWAPLVCRSGKALADTGVMRNSWHISAIGSDSVTVATGVHYANTHQYGATIMARNAPYLRFRCGKRWVSRKSVVIPARPMVPASGKAPQAWMNAFERQARNWLRKQAVV